ncbi:MAG: SUMF1/EgtB/PvdO family nonheme iron enzyme [Nannocystaceae bacterium]
MVTLAKRVCGLGRRSRRGRLAAAAAALAPTLGVLAALAGCSRGKNLAAHLAPTQDLAGATSGQARCGVAKSHDRPLIIEWPSADRGALESEIGRGDHLVVVRYEGCEMELLRRCRARGAYAFTALERKEESSALRSADDLYAKIPLGAARLEAELERHGALRLAMMIVGAYEADLSQGAGLVAALDPANLEGRCEGATHVVTGISVGAFALTSASGAGVKAGAEVGGLGEGVGGGVSSTHSRGFRRSDGDPDACRRSSYDGPPERCGALLRIEVEALAEPTPEQFAATTVSAPRRKGRCPKGSALVEGGVYTPSGDARGVWGDGWGGNQSVGDLCVALHEVSVAEYSRCVRDGACSQAPATVQWSDIDDAVRAERSALCNGARRSRRRHPVNCVTWHQAESYCRAVGGRLPSEGEWEWAARGGDQHRSYAWGEDDPDPSLVNACGRECSTPENLFDRRDGYRGTAPTGAFRRGRGRWHLEDLAGNVWEWTQSGDADGRVVRGGGFSTVDDAELRVGGREAIELRARRADVGFRCVWDPADAP